MRQLKIIVDAILKDTELLIKNGCFESAKSNLTLLNFIYDWAGNKE